MIASTLVGKRESGNELMFATLYLPKLYLQAAMRHQPELRSKPVALLDDNEKRAVIIQLNEPAEMAGVRIGMTPSQGLPRCLSLIVKARGRRQEKLIDEILLHYAFTLSPSLQPPPSAFCPIQFTPHLHLLPNA